MLTTIVLVHLGCFAAFLFMAARAPIIEDMDDAAPVHSLNPTALDGSLPSSDAALQPLLPPASRAAA